MKNIVFMGTPSFAVPILKDLFNSDEYNVMAVVTQPDRPFGRKRMLKASPVKELAKDLDIPVLQPEKISGSKEMTEIIDMKPDFIITAAFGQFLPTKLLDSAKFAAVNVHGSLLPKYRGGAPVQYSIMNGDKQTGVSIMYMVKKMDAGDVLSQSAINIESDDDTASIFEKLSKLGSQLLLKTLPKVIDGSVKPLTQDESKVVFSPTIKRSEEKLDFSQSAFLIDCKVRALRPDPSAYTILNGKRTKVWVTKPLEQKTDLNPGEVVTKNKKHLLIACGNGTVISILELQPAGKPKQNISSYINGAGQNIKEKEQVITNE
ncbi:methionyl-tRNA formyltransferase [Apilactobacillus apisilvae]|uniref:Methionyl-tRNA formyltransferase n=1 Tax=Apilactobacillus apisilvae TaxID=2923364 RepID=A0ABY4PHP1_9LACO|nr:methionyl-tRNA formyltransferase [Apilactobacillus apisilvae]UQS85324.1 methionyl-tRNA formyltransferase [Apilactobacillus apisilvae]